MYTENCCSIQVPVKLDATERQEKLQPLINKGEVKQKDTHFLRVEYGKRQRRNLQGVYLHGLQSSLGLHVQNCPEGKLICLLTCWFPYTTNDQSI